MQKTNIKTKSNTIRPFKKIFEWISTWKMFYGKGEDNNNHIVRGSAGNSFPRPGVVRQRIVRHGEELNKKKRDNHNHR